ncbi:MAG: PIN domain nuclease [Deltaproteobacteria bacterium]|nr:PIN domain nuclease [Deltaproteobacteria bacterium]
MIAFERGDARVRNYVLLAARGHLSLATSSAVVAQVWRGGTRQARLARVLRSRLLEEVPFGEQASRAVGVRAAATGATDVVDGHVVFLASIRDALVATSDPDDLRRWGLCADCVIRC